MESKKVESNAELTPFEKEFKVQLNLPAAYFSVFYVIYVAPARLRHGPHPAGRRGGYCGAQAGRRDHRRGEPHCRAKYISLFSIFMHNIY